MVFSFFLILIFLLFGRPQDFFLFLAPYRLTFLFIILTFGLTMVSGSGIAFSRIISIKESKRYLILFFIMIIGIPFAYHRKVAFDYVFFKYLSNILFFFLFLVHVHSLEKLKKTLFVICVSILFYAGMCLTQGTFVEGRFFSGTMYDPNDLAYFFVSLFPLFFLFSQKNERLTKRILSILGVALSLGIIVLTGSRGGLVGLIAILGFIIFTKMIIEKQSIKILLFLVLTLILFYNINRINVERFQSLTNLSSDYNLTDETGRLKIWKRALKLTVSNPITGVGVGCFSKAIGEQRMKEGALPKWQAPHNSYIQILTETGVFGFIVFISLVFSCIQFFFHLAKNETIIKGSDPYSFMAGILAIGFTGSLISGFFLTQAYSIIFTFYFALSAVLRYLVTQAEMNGNTNSMSQQL